MQQPGGGDFSGEGHWQALALVSAAAGFAGSATVVAQEITKREVISDSLKAGDKTRKVSRLGGGSVESYYDCHTLKLAAGDGVRISAQATSNDGAEVWARIANPACTAVQQGLADRFIAREPATIGILVTTEAGASMALPYRLTIERFDGAAVLKDAANAADAERAAKQGVEALQAGNTSAALDRLQAAQRLLPDNPAVNYFLGVAQRASGQAAQAEASLWRTLAAPRVDTENMVWLGAIGELNAIVDDRITAGDLAQAERSLKKLQEINGLDPLTNFNLMSLSNARKDYVSAMGHAYTLASYYPLDPSVWSNFRMLTEAVAKGAPANGRDPAKTRALLETIDRTIEEMPFHLERPDVSHEGSYTRLKGRIIGNTAPKGTVYRVTFNTGDAKDYATRELIVAAPAKGQAVAFEKRFHAGRPLRVSYGYKACPTCKPEVGPNP